MNRFRTLALTVGALIFLGSIGASIRLLPDRVVSHYGLHGEGNAWMSKESDVLFLGAVGLGLPLFVLGLTYVTRFFPNEIFNLPNKDYWLAPERRKQTVDFIFHHTFWAAAMMFLFLSWVNVLNILANRQPVPKLSIPGIWGGLALFVAALVFWMVRLNNHFRNFGSPASSHEKMTPYL